MGVAVLAGPDVFIVKPAVPNVGIHALGRSGDAVGRPDNPAVVWLGARPPMPSSVSHGSTRDLDPIRQPASISWP